MMIGYMLNGLFTDGSCLEVQVDQPYFAHGTGLFETLRCHQGTPCFLVPHVERMRRTAELLSFDFPVDCDSVRGQIGELMARTGSADARLRFHLLVRGDGGSDFLLTAENVDPMKSMSDPIVVGPAPPEFNGATAMSGLKTMNYMVNRLAEAAGREKGYSDVVFTRKDGTVLEGTRSTFFMVRDGQLETPGLDLPILPGVTRMVVLELAKRLGVGSSERNFHFDELREADEAFLTGSVAGIRPIQQVEDSMLKDVPGPVTRKLADAYWNLATGTGEL